MARWAQLIADNDPDVWVQRGQEAHQPLDGEEVVEPATLEEQHLRLIDAEQFCSLGLTELARLEDLDDPGREFRLRK